MIMRSILLVLARSSVVPVLAQLDASLDDFLNRGDDDLEKIPADTSHSSVLYYDLMSGSLPHPFSYDEM